MSILKKSVYRSSFLEMIWKHDLQQTWRIVKQKNTQCKIHWIISDYSTFHSHQVSFLNSHCSVSFQCWSEKTALKMHLLSAQTIRRSKHTLKVHLHFSAPTQLGLSATNALMTCSQFTLPFLFLPATVWSGNDKDGNCSWRMLAFKNVIFMCIHV